VSHWWSMIGPRMNWKLKNIIKHKQKWRKEIRSLGRIGYNWRWVRACRAEVPRSKRAQCVYVTIRWLGDTSATTRGWLLFFFVSLPSLYSPCSDSRNWRQNSNLTNYSTVQHTASAAAAAALRDICVGGWVRAGYCIAMQWWVKFRHKTAVHGSCAIDTSD
jgi:hypothetical protein